MSEYKDPTLEEAVDRVIDFLDYELASEDWILAVKELRFVRMQQILRQQKSVESAAWPFPTSKKD